MWDLASGACQLELTGHTGRLNGVRVGPGGATALTVSDDYTARIWDLASGTCLHVLKGARSCLHATLSSASACMHGTLTSAPATWLLLCGICVACTLVFFGSICSVSSVIPDDCFICAAATWRLCSAQR